MSEKCLGIIMNGVIARMGKNQHLIRSILVGRDTGRIGMTRPAVQGFPLVILHARPFLTPGTGLSDDGPGAPSVWFW